MNVTETKSEKLLREYAINIPAAEYHTLMTQKLLQMGQKAKVPGFRPGKIPMPILQQRYEASYRLEVVEKIVDRAVDQLLKDRGYRPALRPQVDFKEFSPEKDIHFTVSFEILPDVPALEIEKIALERPVSEPSPEKREQVYKRVRESKGQLLSVEEDRETRLGDVVVIDFTGTCEGQPIARGAGQDTPLELGSKSFIDTFEEQLVGKKKGDHVTVNVSFPADYQSTELAGKPAQFEVDIKDIKSLSVPDTIDESMAKDMGFDDIEAFEKALLEQLQKECDSMSFMIAKRRLLDHLAEISFDIPQGLRDVEFKTIWERYLSFEKKGSPQDPTALEADQAQYRQIADRRVRLGLLLADVGKKHDVQVSKEQMNEAMLSFIQRYPGEERKVYEYLRKNPSALDSLRAPIFEDNVVKFILGKAQVTDEKVSYDVLEKMLKEITEGDEE